MFATFAPAFHLRQILHRHRSVHIDGQSGRWTEITRSRSGGWSACGAASRTALPPAAVRPFPCRRGGRQIEGNFVPEDRAGILVKNTVGCAIVSVARLADGADINQETFAFLQHKIFRWDQTRRLAAADDENAGLMSVPNEQERFLYFTPAGNSVLRLENIMKSGWFIEIGMGAAEVFGQT